MHPKKALALSLNVLALAILACRTGNPDRKLNLYPTATNEATQTPVIVQVTIPVVVQITTTPAPTQTVVRTTPTKRIKLCVTATEAVYVRPSPDENNYPITSLTNGVEVTYLDWDGDWIFIEVGDRRGWVYRKYIKLCE